MSPGHPGRWEVEAEKEGLRGAVLEAARAGAPAGPEGRTEEGLCARQGWRAAGGESWARLK